MAVGKFHNKGTASGGGTLTTTLREYIAGDTWNKPSGLIMVDVICVGAGGGGGSGARTATGVLARGGGGGAPGNIVFNQVRAADLASSVTVTIGAGGTGAAAITVNDTQNGNGGTGGDTSFGSHCLAKGGNGAVGANGGATRSLGTADEPDYSWFFIAGQNGQNSAGAGGSGSAANSQQLGGNTLPNYAVNPGAASGGGVTTGNAQSAGGAGSRIYNFAGTLSTAPTAGTSGGGTGGAGVDNASDRMASSPIITSESPTYGIGSSGAGGGSSTTAAGGAGGAGGNYSGAGGGGGASRNGSNSGAGGAGGGGLCFVLEYTIS
jgi:hypothetical protein